MKVQNVSNRLMKMIDYEYIIEKTINALTHPGELMSDGECMDEEKRICDYDILPSSYIMVEMLEDKSEWIFWNSKKPFFGECGDCKSR